MTTSSRLLASRPAAVALLWAAAALATAGCAVEALVARADGYSLNFSGDPKPQVGGVGSIDRRTRPRMTWSRT